LLNICVAIFITLSSYYHLPLNGFEDRFMYVVHFLILQFSFFGILYFLSINKYVFYSTFPILFLSLALLAFYKYTQDIIISKSLIEAIFETSLLVTVDLIYFYFILYILIAIAVLVFLLKKYQKLKINPLKSPLTVLAILGICSFYLIENYRHDTFKSRMPYVTFYSIKEFLQEDHIKLLPINKDVTSSVNEVNFIFILGESARADHMQLNGYQRETNPKLSKNKNVISFSKLYTPLTYTVASVKQLLTNESINDTIKATELYAIYSILNAINYNTYWIGNSTVVKSYEPIIMSNTSVALIDKFRSIMSFNKALDEEMLQPLDSILFTKKNQFITLHMTGSHWWYENRYSDEFRKFKPVIDSKHIPSLEKEEIINSYDNTLLYLDNFIDTIISSVQKVASKSIVIYVADHGEILGENGKWLHAQEDESSKNPAMLIWYSDSFKDAYPSTVDNLIKNANKPITTDFLYHSILDFYQVKNFSYDPSKSIFQEDVNY
tara:strand:+ start:238782 stop:240263 length:1482 start_codon:yes stop_codon:yes gene_type:complete